MKTLLVFLLLAACSISPATAEDITSKVKIDARPRTVERETERFGVHRKKAVTLHQTTLHAKIENLSYNALPAAKVEYVIQLTLAAGPADARRTRTIHGEGTVEALRSRGNTEASFGSIDLRSANFTDREDEITGWTLKFTYENGDTAAYKSSGFKNP